MGELRLDELVAAVAFGVVLGQDVISLLLLSSGKEPAGRFWDEAERGVLALSTQKTCERSID